MVWKTYTYLIPKNQFKTNIQIYITYLVFIVNISKKHLMNE